MVNEEALRGYATFKSLFINLFYIKGAPSTSVHYVRALHRPTQDQSFFGK